LLRETELFNRHEFYIPIVIPYHLIALSQEGQYSRAAALMRAYFEVTVSYIGLPFPMAWARQWGLLIRLRAELETALGPEAFQAAWKQGTALTMADLVVELEQFVAGIL
jgi:hypothetical protein